MAWFTKTRVKYALAGAGALYVVLFVGYLVYAGTRSSAPVGPSELEAHPERQAEIVARRHAEELRDQLQLTEEQTQKIAVIFQKYDASQFAGGDLRERMRAQRGEIELVLTPGQKALWEQLRGQFRGPGGPGGFDGTGGPAGMPPPGAPGGQVTPERMEQLKQSMTPEQRDRFDKAMQRMQQMRGQGGPRRDGEVRGKGMGEQRDPEKARNPNKVKGQGKGPKKNRTPEQY
mgnify:CR=1 FL=1